MQMYKNTKSSNTQKNKLQNTEGGGQREWNDIKRTVQKHNSTTKYNSAKAYTVIKIRQPTNKTIMDNTKRIIKTASKNT